MKRLAIVGATGLVGQMVLRVLKEEGLNKKFELFMITSKRSSGQVLEFDNMHYRLIELNNDVFKLKLDYAVFVTGEDVSKVWVKNFESMGVVVIDNSSAFRLEKNIPLVVPEINFESIGAGDKIIANPNCSTIQLVLVLDRLKKLSDFESVVVSSYQSVSGAGKEALQDLDNDTCYFFEHGITNNYIAQIGAISENGNCSEENKIIFETQKILKEKFNIAATAVRVPVNFCHGESVYVKFKNNIDFERVKKVLECDYIKVSDALFYPKDCAGSNHTFVCRVRRHSDNEILFFVIADNLRRGAAFNAVEILKRLLKT